LNGDKGKHLHNTLPVVGKVQLPLAHLNTSHTHRKTRPNVQEDGSEVAGVVSGWQVRPFVIIRTCNRRHCT